MPFNRPDDRMASDTAYIRGPEYGLAEGEWVQYWANLPHTLKTRLTTEATVATLTREGRVAATFDPGAAALARVRVDIVAWNLLDHDGQPVAWEPDRARELVDGLPEEAFDFLTRNIGFGPANLNAPAPTDPDQVEGAPLGEG